MQCPTEERIQTRTRKSFVFSNCPFLHTNCMYVYACSVTSAQKSATLLKLKQLKLNRLNFT